MLLIKHLSVIYMHIHFQVCSVHDCFIKCISWFSVLVSCFNHISEWKILTNTLQCTSISSNRRHFNKNGISKWLHLAPVFTIFQLRGIGIKVKLLKLNVYCMLPWLVYKCTKQKELEKNKLKWHLRSWTHVNSVYSNNRDLELSLTDM